MSVPIAYLGVIFIWSTTPLATQWSTGSFSPLAAASLRLLLAWLLVVAVALLLRAPALELRRHWRLYAAGSLGLFPNLALINGAAQYLPSGLISVMFGLSPFVVNGLAGVLLGGSRPSWRDYAALSLSLAGLVTIFSEQLTVGDDTVLGMLLMSLSILLFSLSSVLVKRYSGTMGALNQLQGSLVMAIPGMLCCWLLLDGRVPDAISVRSGSALVYLAIAGSIVGVWAYLYLLANVAMGMVSIIPLITPAFALLLGAGLNGESLSLSLLLGSLLILLGLWLFNRVS